jgi:hypothetical protein
MSLSRRRIDVTFRLGKGSFGTDGSNTVKITGKRISATISQGDGRVFSSLSLRISGLPIEILNQLTTLQMLQINEVRHNTITVEAGTGDGQMTVVFDGTIANAWAQMDPPDAVLTVDAFEGLFNAMRPIPATSYNGYVDAGTVVSGLAHQMNMGFENGGVTAQLHCPYYPGTGMDQVQQCADAAPFNWGLYGNVIAIWPKGGSRLGQHVLISPDTGMIGYPTWTSAGIIFRTMFNPSIALVTPGLSVEVDTQMTPAKGKWTVFKVSHDLESETPGGQWFTMMEAVPFGHPTDPGQ